MAEEQELGAVNGGLMPGCTDLRTAGETGLTASREETNESQMSPRPFVPSWASAANNPLGIRVCGTWSVSVTLLHILLPWDPNLHISLWKALLRLSSRRALLHKHPQSLI